MSEVATDPAELRPAERAGAAPARRGARGAAALRAAVVAAMLAFLTALHFGSSPHATALHQVLFKATFLPLVLAGLWFGLRGAALASAVTIALYLVHIVSQLRTHGGHELGVILADVGLYATMSLTAGVLADRRMHALHAAERHAEELREKTRLLFRAEEDLRRADRLRSLGELAAGVAHELRNPLGGIRGAGEILARESTSPEARAEFREVLVTEIDRLDRVVENFLLFARPPAGRPEPLDLAAEAGSTLLLVSAEAERRGVRCRVEASAPARATADPGLLRQVLLNVALNGLQAMGPGGSLVLRIASGPPAAIEVEDTGGGIDPAILPRVFDPFVTARPGGTGLGLSTSYRIMESMGGSIEVARTGPTGTVVRIVLGRG